MVGLSCNQWVLGRLFSPGGRIDELNLKLIILLFEVFMITFGIITLKKKDGLILELNLLLWTIIIVTPLLGELLFRTGILLNIKNIKSPSLYADPDADDDYWNLYRYWEQGQLKAFMHVNGQLLRKYKRIHPLLGWTEANITMNNPLGLQEDSLKQLGSMNPKILFYGDSFVKGMSDKEFIIPRYMNSKISRMDVINMGVGGYGLDQIYQLFKETYQKAHDPLILVGILGNDDLDRTILTVRRSQKPYFIIDTSGNLQLKGVPIEKDQRKYFENHPLSIKSYFFAYIKQKLFAQENKIDMKKQISSKLLELFKLNSDNAKDKLIFILFYRESSLSNTDWQEKFLKDALQQMGAHYIDTKDILLQYARDKNLKLSMFYKQKSQHHNNLGNQVIAEGIIKYLRSNNYIKS